MPFNLEEMEKRIREKLKPPVPISPLAERIREAARRRRQPRLPRT